jgi:serine/threonine-protein kinase RsbW
MMLKSLKTPETPLHKILLRMRIPSAGEPVFKARNRLAATARRLGFRDEALDGILLAFSEAVTNAIVYGNTSARNSVRIRVAVENSRLVIEISDHGQGFHPDKVRLPPAECMCEGGRGLYLMRAFMDEVEWIPTGHGTTVRMAKCCVSLPRPDADPATTSGLPASSSLAASSGIPSANPSSPTAASPAVPFPAAP